MPTYCAAVHPTCDYSSWVSYRIWLGRCRRRVGPWRAPVRLVQRAESQTCARARSYSAVRGTVALCASHWTQWPTQRQRPRRGLQHLRSTRPPTPSRQSYLHTPHTSARTKQRRSRVHWVRVRVSGADATGHGRGGGVPPTFTNGWARGTPWAEERLQSNDNYANNSTDDCRTDFIWIFHIECCFSCNMKRFKDVKFKLLSVSNFLKGYLLNWKMQKLTRFIFSKLFKSCWQDRLYVLFWLFCASSVLRVIFFISSNTVPRAYELAFTIWAFGEKQQNNRMLEIRQRRAYCPVTIQNTGITKSYFQVV